MNKDEKGIWTYLKEVIDARVFELLLAHVITDVYVFVQESHLKTFPS